MLLPPRGNATALLPDPHTVTLRPRAGFKPSVNSGRENYSLCGWTLLPKGIWLSPRLAWSWCVDQTRRKSPESEMKGVAHHDLWLWHS